MFVKIEKQQNKPKDCQKLGAFPFPQILYFFL